MTGETRDGTGWGDHDTAWEWGGRMACLTFIQQSRCVRMRGLVRDMKHAPDNLRGELKYSGDDADDNYVLTPGGILVTQTAWLGNWTPQAT